MAKFRVKVKYEFVVNYAIKANSQEEANRFALDHCGLVLGGDIHSSLPSEDVDWVANVHPDQSIFIDE